MQAAIDASMREAPGGAAAGPTFLEALRVDGDVRRERRTRIAGAAPSCVALSVEL